jgi:hypothetical protein
MNYESSDATALLLPVATQPRETLVLLIHSSVKMSFHSRFLFAWQRAMSAIIENIQSEAKLLGVSRTASALAFLPSDGFVLHDH